MAFSKYDQMGATKITKNRNMVISRCLPNGGYTIAQQLEVDEMGKKTKVFMKGAIFVDSTEHLRDVKNMIDSILKIVEEQENTEWDDVEDDKEDQVDLTTSDYDNEWDD